MYKFIIILGVLFGIFIPVVSDAQTPVPAFRVNLSGTQTVTTVTDTVVSFDTIVFDTTNDFSTTTYRYTPDRPGFYFLNCQLSSAGTPPFVLNSRIRASIRINGVVTGLGQTVVQAVTGTRQLIAGTSLLWYFNGSSDYADCSYFSDEASPAVSAVPQNTSFTGAFISSTSTVASTTSAIILAPVDATFQGIILLFVSMFIVIYMFSSRKRL